MYTIHDIDENIIISIHIIVPSTNSMSILANILFLNPNCIGVNARLNSRFNMKGRHIKMGIFPLIVLRNIYPNDIAISMYSTVQAGPNNQEGGAHLGFLSCLYHWYVCIL